MCLHYACIALSCIESLCTCDRGCAFCPSLFVKRSRYILCLCLHLSNCHPSSQASCRKHHFFTSDMRTQLYAGMGSTCSTTCTTRRFWMSSLFRTLLHLFSSGLACYILSPSTSSSAKWVSPGAGQCIAVGWSGLQCFGWWVSGLCYLLVSPLQQTRISKVGRALFLTRSKFSCCICTYMCVYIYWNIYLYIYIHMYIYMTEFLIRLYVHVRAHSLRANMCIL